MSIYMRAQQGIRELARDKSENHHGNEHDNEASECTSTTGSASGSGSLTPMEGSLATTEHTTPVSSPDHSTTSPSSGDEDEEEDDTSKSSLSSSSQQQQQPGRSELSDHSNKKLLRRTVPIYMISSTPSETKTSPRHNTNGIVEKQYVVRMVSADVRTDASGSNYTAYIMSVEVMEHPISGGAATREVNKESAAPGLLLKDIVEHRYSEFAKLHAELEANLVSMASPFPSKQRLLFNKACFWKQDDRHHVNLQEEMRIHQRKTQLDAWLMELCDWLNRGDLRGTLYDSVLEFFTVSAALPCDRANPISFNEWRHQTSQQQHDNNVSPETDSTTDESPNHTESNEEDYIFDEEEDTFDNDDGDDDDDDDDLGFVMGDLPDADDHAVGSEKHLSKPVTFTLGSSIRQAAYTVMHMCCPPTHTNLYYDQKHDISIPLDLLRNAKGLCFLTVVKAGFVISGRVGTGLVIARRPDGSWSPPTAIGTVGVGWGALIGGDITDYLLVLNTDGAVRSFGGTGGTSGTVNLGAELGVAMGPVGRSATGNVQASDEGVHPVYAYAHSKGLFVGMSFEGSVVTSRSDVNAKFYGRPLEPAHILFDSTVPQPRAAEPLYEALDLAMGIEMPVDGIRPSQLLTKKQLAAAAGDVSRRVSESIRNKYREHQQLRSQITQTSSPVPTIPASELDEPKSS
eukprot:scaffold8928_cov41-Attheya_sp.AAC.3